MQKLTMKLLIVLMASHLCLARPDVSSLQYLPPHRDVAHLDGGVVGGGGTGLQGANGLGDREDHGPDVGENLGPSGGFAEDGGPGSVPENRAFDKSESEGQPESVGEEGPQGPAQYEFHYDVDNEETGTKFGHQEMRDGDYTQGTYNVVLPDGRKQIVDYEADTGGYKPKVRYEGEENFGGQEKLIGGGQSGEGQLIGGPDDEVSASHDGVQHEENLNNGVSEGYSSDGTGSDGVFHEDGHAQDNTRTNGLHSGYPSGRPNEGSLHTSHTPASPPTVKGSQVSTEVGNGYPSANGHLPSSNSEHQGYPSGISSTTNGGLLSTSNNHGSSNTNEDTQLGPTDGGSNGYSSSNDNQHGYPLSGSIARNGGHHYPSNGHGNSRVSGSKQPGHINQERPGYPSATEHRPGANSDHQGYPSGRPGGNNGVAHQPSNGHGSSLINGETQQGNVNGGGSGYPSANRHHSGPKSDHQGYPSSKPSAKNGVPPHSSNGHGSSNANGNTQPGHIDGGVAGYPSANGHHPGSNGGHQGYPSGKHSPTNGGGHHPSNGHGSSNANGNTQPGHINGGVSGYPPANGHHPGQNGGHQGYPSVKHSTTNGGGHHPSNGYSSSHANGNTQPGHIAGGGQGYPSANGHHPGPNGGHEGYPSSRPGAVNGGAHHPSNTHSSSHKNGGNVNGGDPGYSSVNGHHTGQTSDHQGYPSGKPSAKNGGPHHSSNGHGSSHANGITQPGHIDGVGPGYPSANGHHPGPNGDHQGYPSGKHSPTNGGGHHPSNGHGSSRGNGGIQSGHVNEGGPGYQLTNGHPTDSYGDHQGYPSEKPNSLMGSSGSSPTSSNGHSGYSSGQPGDGFMLPSSPTGPGRTQSNGQIHQSNGNRAGYHSGYHPGTKGDHQGHPAGKPSTANGVHPHSIPFSGGPRQGGEQKSPQNGGEAGYPSDNGHRLASNGRIAGYSSDHSTGPIAVAESSPGRGGSHANAPPAGYSKGPNHHQTTNGVHTGYPSGHPGDSYESFQNPSGPATDSFKTNEVTPSSRENARSFTSGNGGHSGVSSGHPGYPSGRLGDVNGGHQLPSSSPDHDRSHSNGDHYPSHVNNGSAGYPSANGHRPGSGYGTGGQNGNIQAQMNGDHQGYPDGRPVDYSTASHSESNAPSEQKDHLPTNEGGQTYPIPQSPNEITPGHSIKPQGSGNGDLSEDGYHY